MPPTLSGVNQRSAGTVTFLFTDLEGSTRLWEQHPEAMRTRSRVTTSSFVTRSSQHNGRIVKMTGDGVHAVFAEPRATRSRPQRPAQRAITVEPWGEHRAVAGPHRRAHRRRRAPRRRLLRHRRESRRTTDGGRARRADPRVARHRGARRATRSTTAWPSSTSASTACATSSRPERVFQLAAPGCPTTSRRSVARRRSPATSRRRSRRSSDGRTVLDDRRRAPDRALVTITGTGGVGKTRLAAADRGALLDDYRDGAWLCELGVADDEEPRPSR